MNEYLYLPIEIVNEETLKPTGTYRYGCVTNDKLGRQIIFPLGYCRKDKCIHKTKQEAMDCFRKYELDHDVRGYSGEDFNSPDGKVIEGRNKLDKCVICGTECKSYIQVGIRNIEYYLCEKHLDRESFEKIYPFYTEVK